MPFIEQVTDEEAAGRAQELLDAERASLGYVQNFTRLFATRPDVFDAWQQLRTAIAGPMDTRRYELATVAAAAEIRCSYCSLAHGKILAEQFDGTETVLGLVSGDGSDALDAADRAVVDLARKVADEAASVTEDDIDRLREAGLTDGEIFEVILAAAARCFFSKVLDAAGVLPDATFRSLEPPELREALTVGRPIA